MSAQTGSSIDAVEIYVPLLNEGTDVLRPALGMLQGADVARLLQTPDYDPAAEEWQFPPGSKVRLVTETRGGRNLLVARQLADGSTDG